MGREHSRGLQELYEQQVRGLQGQRAEVLRLQEHVEAAQQGLRDLHNQAGVEFRRLEEKIKRAENVSYEYGMGRGSGDKAKGYLPLKVTMPGKLSKTKYWRRWRKKFLGHVDEITPGMEKLLEDLERMDSTHTHYSNSSGASS